MAAAQDSPIKVVRWVLDTRHLWPEAQSTKALETAASDALSLLSDEERKQVLRFYFVKDAKLALGSALLKRLAISRLAGVGWDEAVWTHNERTKPVFRRAADGAEPMIFNVTHQAGIVALVAVQRPEVDGNYNGDDDNGSSIAVGIDVVCRKERRDRDRETISKEGWPHYVGIHKEVFSKAETDCLVNLPDQDHHHDRHIPHGQGDGDDVDGALDGVDRRLAYFYTLWCLREAYIKMTGDALLAPWLGDLEMRYFAPPPGHDVPPPPEGGGSGGDDDRPLEIWFRGRRVDDVHVRLETLLRDYVLCTAVRCGTAHRAFFEAEVARPVTMLTLEEVMAGAADAKRTR